MLKENVSKSTYCKENSGKISYQEPICRDYILSRTEPICRDCIYMESASLLPF